MKKIIFITSLFGILLASCSINKGNSGSTNSSSEVSSEASSISSKDSNSTTIISQSTSESSSESASSTSTSSQSSSSSSSSETTSPSATLDLTVSYIIDDVIYKTVKIKSGETFRLETPEKEHYTFDGWYTDEARTTKYKEETERLINDTKVYRTTDVSHIMSFMPNGTNITLKTIDSNSNIKTYTITLS